MIKTIGSTIRTQCRRNCLAYAFLLECTNFAVARRTPGQMLVRRISDRTFSLRERDQDRSRGTSFPLRIGVCIPKNFINFILNDEAI